MPADLLLLLNDTLLMLESCIVTGGRLDYMCAECGGDDGGLGGDKRVQHGPGCAFIALREKIDTELGGFRKRYDESRAKGVV